MAFIHEYFEQDSFIFILIFFAKVHLFIRKDQP